jgi:anhydro-N-acetylmuramic acid kinase
LTVRENGPLVERLARIVSADERRVVGLMSGTSFDGVDAALVRVSGSGAGLRVELDRFEYVPFADGMRDRIRQAQELRVPELARLHFDLGEAFAEAAIAVIEAAGLAPSDIDLIGSHGQTVFHDPASPGRGGVTLQIGEADVIAHRTGIVTVSDFRTADVAAGGSGAPLIPLVDWLLFRKEGTPRLMLNIGGIANVTLVTDRREDLVAFDTGPGNALMDEIVRAGTGGSERFDDAGRRAGAGTASDEAADRFLEHPYFSTPPPKSTGKELFGASAARELARMTLGDGSLEGLTEKDLSDLLATAALVTARSVREAAEFVSRPATFAHRFGRASAAPAEVLVSGGGVRNEAVMSRLSRLFDPVPVMSLEERGMDPDAKEAVGFAVLASESVAGRPGNVPAATGAGVAVVLGKISPGIMR